MKDEEYNIPDEEYYIDDRPVVITDWIKNVSRETLEMDDEEYYIDDRPIQVIKFVKNLSRDERDALREAIDNRQVKTDEECYSFIEEYRKNAAKG